MAKIHRLHDATAVKTDALLQRAEGPPMWQDSQGLPDDRTGIGGLNIAGAMGALTPLGTLPSPPSHMDLRLEAARWAENSTLSVEFKRLHNVSFEGNMARKLGEV